MSIVPDRHPMQMRRLLAGALAVVLAVAWVGWSGGFGLVSRCPDPESAARELTRRLPTPDYESSPGPSELARRADRIVTGTLVDVVLDTGSVALQLSDVVDIGRVEDRGSPDAATSGLTITINHGATTPFDTASVDGVMVLAFLIESDPHGDSAGSGQWNAVLDGLSFACDVDGAAWPVLTEPSGGEWPALPTIDGLSELAVSG